MITVIDSGIGNIASVVNMIRKVGGRVEVATNANEISSKAMLILPGVGSFDSGINALRKTGMDEAIKRVVRIEGGYLIGICLGMQMLFESSEEGKEPGLGIMSGCVQRFNTSDVDIRVPHMGWNTVRPTRESKLFRSTETDGRFYFVHSYHVVCPEPYVAATTEYGYRFTCAVECENVLGVQFHPEKSHKYGMNLFKRLVELSC